MANIRKYLADAKANANESFSNARSMVVIVL